MLSAIFHRLSNQVDDFLPRWTENMDTAGYLASTTAKREDCILSFRWFMEPLLEAVEKQSSVSFGELIKNTGNWADTIVQTSRRHRSRGVTGDMFIGCFKTLVHAVLDLIDAGDEPVLQKVAARQFVQAGASTKEIAETLNLSVVTIQTHRRSIRRKLDLQNRNVNLHTFLNRMD